MEVTISLSFHIINTNDCVIPLMKSFDWSLFLNFGPCKINILSKPWSEYMIVF
jgi:hypothetical protein